MDLFCAFSHINDLHLKFSVQNNDNYIQAHIANIYQNDSFFWGSQKHPLTITLLDLEDPKNELFHQLMETAS